MWIENQSVNSAFALARQGTDQCPTHFSQATGETRLFRRTLTCPLYRSDMPQTQKGSWFLHYREKMDANLIEGIKGFLYEIWHTRERIKRMKEEGREPPKYLRKYFGNPIPHCSSPFRHMLNNVSKPASDWRNMRFLPDF